jgi:hypothetical protein
VDILHDVEFMFLYDGTAFVPHIETEERKERVVERLRDGHVFDRYLDVVNDRFHCSSLLLPQRPRSQVREVLRLLEPVVATIDVGDGHPRKLFLRYVLETAQVDAVHLSQGSLVSDPERPHATVLAEVVEVLSGVEQVLRQLRFARQ